MQRTAQNIVKIFHSAGFKAYYAGGCVRDMLLGKTAKDYDIVTSAKPEDIEKLLSHTIPVGKQFGVMLAIENGHKFEVATFRSDSGYSDGRRPDAVLFTNPEEDAKRRDFTINGLFYDPIKNKIHDYIGGQEDLQARLIRFIGDPHKRILEDHLRILRAIRLKTTLNFQYHPQTYKAIIKHAHLSNRVSGERVQQELNKIMFSDYNVVAFEDMYDTGVLKHILPEITAMKGVAQPYKYHQEGDVWAHSMKALASLPIGANLALKWAALLHDIGKPETFKITDRIRFDAHVKKSKEITEDILRRLKYPRRFIERVTWLTYHHMILLPLKNMPIGRRRHWFLHPNFPDLMEVFKADIAGTTPSDYSLFNQVKRSYQHTLRTLPKKIKPLLNGEEIMKLLELKPGKKVGKIINELREKQLAQKIKTKNQALTWAVKRKRD